MTITDNLVDYSGGGICCWDSSSRRIVNCIFWNNLPQEVVCTGGNPVTITISYSNIYGGEEGIATGNYVTVNWLECNIDVDPIFMDAGMGDYHLTEDSPCIDTGTSYFEYDGEVLVDLSEDEYFGSEPDMGAYEYGLVSTGEFIIQNSKFPQSF